MKTLKNSTWLACYLYYTLSPQEILINKVFPIIQTVLKNHWAEQYFFIRYYDKRGLHIRLRFKGNKKLLETKLQPFLAKIFPDSRFVTYRPELKRYGGRYGIIIAEKLFEASSQGVLSFLAENREVNYEHSFGFALQLNLSMIHALGLKKKEATEFFNHLALAGNRQQFAKNFSGQESTLIPHLSDLWEALDQLTMVDKAWFNQWIYNIQLVGDEIKRAQQKELLRPLDPEKKHNNHPLWYLYESYVHMNNNRLGINNDDEKYIAYILKRALSYGK